MFAHLLNIVRYGCGRKFCVEFSACMHPQFDGWSRTSDYELCLLGSLEHASASLQLMGHLAIVVVLQIVGGRSTFLCVALMLLLFFA